MYSNTHTHTHPPRRDDGPVREHHGQDRRPRQGRRILVSHLVRTSNVGGLLGIIIECLLQHLNTNTVCVRGSHLQRNPPTSEAPTRGNAKRMDENKQAQTQHRKYDRTMRHIR